jgi:glycine/D-amino acid oxidase-like deaminating enzyme
MKTQPVWLEPIGLQYPRLAEDLTCDVVVIGAGLCGASAANRLAAQGLDVVVLEARTVSESASGRNAGFLLQGTAERYARCTVMMGRERAREIHQVSLDNHDLISDFLVSSGVNAHYRRCGSLQLAGSSQEEEELQQSAAMLREDGFEAVNMARSALPSTLQDQFSMGVSLPQDGEIDPASLVRGLVASAVSQGVRVFEATPVLELDADTMGEAKAFTKNGVVSASVALVCTNARAGDLVPWMKDKVDAVRGQMLATAPDRPLFPQPIYANHGYDYWRQDHLGRIVLGGWRNLDPENEVGHEETVSPSIQERMEEFLRTVGVQAPVSHRWAGIMGFSRDGLPIVGPVPGLPAAVVGAGFTGHGFGFAFAAGVGLADLVTEGTNSVVSMFTPHRFG